MFNPNSLLLSISLFFAKKLFSDATSAGFRCWQWAGSCRVARVLAGSQLVDGTGIGQGLLTQLIRGKEILFKCSVFSATERKWITKAEDLGKLSLLSTRAQMGKCNGVYICGPEQVGSVCRNT